MPNHVDHDLVVTGPADVLDEFEKFAVDGDCLLSADRFIPYPEHFKKADAEAAAARERYQRKEVSLRRVPRDSRRLQSRRVRMVL
jgi:hypothetical protein